MIIHEKPNQHFVIRRIKSIATYLKIILLRERGLTPDLSRR